MSVYRVRFFSVLVLFVAVNTAFSFEISPVFVKVQKADVVEHVPFVDAVGSLVSDKKIIVKPGISGHVEKVLFGNGDKVQAGDVLVKLTRDTLSAGLAALNAELQLRKLTYKRYVRLYSKHAIA